MVGFGLVDAVFVGVVLTLDLHVAELLLDVPAGDAERGHAVDDVDGQAEAVDLVADRQVKRRVDVALLLVAADVEVLVVRPAVCQPMN